MKQNLDLTQVEYQYVDNCLSLLKYIQTIYKLDVITRTWKDTMFEKISQAIYVQTVRLPSWKVKLIEAKINWYLKNG